MKTGRSRLTGLDAAASRCRQYSSVRRHGSLCYDDVCAVHCRYESYSKITGVEPGPEECGHVIGQLSPGCVRRGDVFAPVR